MGKEFHLRQSPYAKGYGGQAGAGQPAWRERGKRINGGGVPVSWHGAGSGREQSDQQPAPY